MGKTVSAEPSAGRWKHTFFKHPKTGLAIQYWETTAAG